MKETLEIQEANRIYVLFGKFDIERDNALGNTPTTLIEVDYKVLDITNPEGIPNEYFLALALGYEWSRYKQKMKGKFGAQYLRPYKGFGRRISVMYMTDKEMAEKAKDWANGIAVIRRLTENF